MTTTEQRESGPYSLRVPCKPCPFRTDVEPYIRPERAQEIAQSLREGADFPCHKTTVSVEDDDGEDDRVATKDSKTCAGALATMEREGAPNQLMRVAERLGLYDPAHLDAERQPVYPSLTAWVRSFYTVPTVTDPWSGEELEFEHCDVVGPDCVDPAGFDGFGGVFANDDEPTCNPLENCHACGKVMCETCRAEDTDDGLPECVECAEDQAA